MIEYRPEAIALDNGKPVHLFTYDGCFSIEDCKKVFKCWQDDYSYSLLVTWIETSENTIIEHCVHVNVIGQVKKI